MQRWPSESCVALNFLHTVSTSRLPIGPTTLKPGKFKSNRYKWLCFVKIEQCWHAPSSLTWCYVFTYFFSKFCSIFCSRWRRTHYWTNSIHLWVCSVCTRSQLGLCTLHRTVLQLPRLLRLGQNTKALKCSNTKKLEIYLVICVQE
jgi:hypothetical protein